MLVVQKTAQDPGPNEEEAEQEGEKTRKAASKELETSSPAPKDPSEDGEDKLPEDEDKDMGIEKKEVEREGKRPEVLLLKKPHRNRVVKNAPTRSTILIKPSVGPKSKAQSLRQHPLKPPVVTQSAQTSITFSKVVEKQATDLIRLRLKKIDDPKVSEHNAILRRV